MKVAYFTESLPPNTDGVVNTMCHLVDSLQDENVDFQFFSPVKPDEAITWHHKVKKVSAVNFPLYKYYRMGLPYLNGIPAILDQFKPDLIHIVSPTLLGLYGLSYAGRIKIPAVTSYHTHFVDYLDYFKLSSLEKPIWSYLQWFHNKCKRTYAPSKSAISDLNQQGINNVELWTRGIEMDKFSPKYNSQELRHSIGADGKPILLFVGRLISHKDLDDLVMANYILKDRGYDFKTVIAGDGPMKKELKNDLPDAHFTGFIYGEELSKWYATADVFTFPSTTETFGNVILEAFASGTPAVGVTQGGVADIINHAKDGLLTRPKDAVDFADHIEILLKNTDFRKELGNQARITAKNFSWKAINKRLFGSYESVLHDWSFDKSMAN